jgi:hypothetical protein
MVPYVWSKGAAREVYSAADQVSKFVCCPPTPARALPWPLCSRPLDWAAEYSPLGRR